VSVHATLPASTAADVDRAYRRCEAITRTQAANFFYGIRLLPRERRRAMCAVYAFARHVDDIGDGALEPGEKLRRLEGEAAALAAIAAEPAAAGGVRRGRGELGTGGEHGGNGARALAPGDAVMLALADAQLRYPPAASVLGELIEGVRMDIAGVAYEEFEQLVVYCRRVAGAIGRACLAIFGMRDGAHADAAHAQGLADDLGVALQLTNILRDVREDARNGRVYLPAEDLARFGVAADGERAAAMLAALEDDRNAGQLAALVRFEAARAREWFDRGIALTALLDRRSAACVLAMAGIYRRLLERIEARPEEAARRRISLPAHEKAWVAARGMLGVGG
jgi:15-cis-phytoene synthase